MHEFPARTIYLLPVGEVARNSLFDRTLVVQVYVRIEGPVQLAWMRCAESRGEYIRSVYDSANVRNEYTHHELPTFIP